MLVWPLPSRLRDETYGLKQVYSSLKRILDVRVVLLFPSEQVENSRCGVPNILPANLHRRKG